MVTDEEIKANVYPSIGGLYGTDCEKAFILGAKWMREKMTYTNSAWEHTHWFTYKSADGKYRCEICNVLHHDFVVVEPEAEAKTAEATRPINIKIYVAENITDGLAKFIKDDELLEFYEELIVDTVLHFMELSHQSNLKK